MNAGRLLKAARRRHGLSQRELAQRAGVPQATVGRIEAGLVSPRLETLMRLLGETGHELIVERRLGEGIDRSTIRDRLRLMPLERVKPAARGSDPVRILRRLRRYGVRFVLIGGLAARAHGSPTSATGIDICHSRDPESLERLSTALHDLRATPRVDRLILEREVAFTFTTKHGRLEIIGTPAGTTGFAELNANAEDMMIAVGLIIRVAALDDLIRIKRAGGQPKDLIDLEVLGALRDEIDRG